MVENPKRKRLAHDLGADGIIILILCSPKYFSGYQQRRAS